jgi:hypothetical protein
MSEQEHATELIDLGAATVVTLGDPGPDQEDPDMHTEEIA